MRVLAIDPGFDRLGVAVVEGTSSHPFLVWSACIEPSQGKPPQRLAEVYSAVLKIVKKYSPDRIAVESLFFSKNKKTALGVAEARGAILAAAGVVGMPVYEYSPQEVKIAVTGYGNAKKEAIMRMVPLLIKIPTGKKRDDEYDAIALGILALSKRYPQDS